MIEFINAHISTPLKSVQETLADLLRIAEIENDTKAESMILALTKNDINHRSNDFIKNYYAAADRLAEKCDLAKKFLRKERSSLKSHSYADFFAGAGGLGEGLSQSGFKCAFSNEIIEKYAETNYLNHTTPQGDFYVGSIEDLHESHSAMINNLVDIDLVCGGPPCQGFSTANRQPLIDDPRNHLYKDFLIVASMIKPKFFLMENVRGMSNKIDFILKDIRTYLGSEYKVEYGFLQAADFGIPQNRTRFILIANRIGVDGSDIFGKIKTKAQESAPTVLADALYGLPMLAPNKLRNDTSTENSEIGFKIRKEPTPKKEFITKINSGRSIDYILNHKNRYNNDRDIEIFRRLPQGENSLHESISDIMPYSNRNHIFKDKFYKLKESEICKTITSHMKFDCNMYIHPTQSRGLSQRESARIQSFPDDYLFRGTPNEWYVQIGNAVPVLMAKAIGTAITEYL